MPEGFVINFAKRVEAMSRRCGSSGITVSQSFVSLCKAAGYPIQLSDPLVGDAKGFESPEPIYEIIGQDIFPERDEDGKCIESIPNAYIIQMAFKRDPERTRWIWELAIGTLFWQGYKSLASWKKGRDLAVEAARMVRDPSRFYFEAGRFAHKLGWNPDSRVHNRENLLESIAYYHAALNDRKMQWAASDLTIVHMRFLEEHGKWREKPTQAEIFMHLELAKQTSDLLVKNFPGHYYSYFLRSICCSQLATFCNKLTLRTREALDIDTKKVAALIQIAERDLETLILLNSSVRLLPGMAEVHLEIAKGNVETASKALNDIKSEFRVKVKDYESTFLQKGVFAPGFRVPPASSFRSRFDSIQKAINKARTLRETSASHDKGAECN